ncbi:MAG TPA: RecX family transcriptional regulator [Sphingomicrobium sp.]|nr:RecX family transcriptional regulator [Sphingomicrobium sp.]
MNGYLRRKLRERGWSGNRDPDLAALCEKLAELGYVDDRAFALACSRSLTGRGYGERRVQQALSLAGIGDEEGVEARDHAAKEAVDAALRFARRRSLGPYATERQDSAKRDKALAAMVRAGHRFALARAVVDLAPGEQPDMESLSENR